tara:strand:+ start:179 stop:349 length:171 start_codon:yes stop_codon:yes gene_type:complete
MTKINKYRNTTEPELVVKGGVTYRVMDLGGSKIRIRVKSDKEMAKDVKDFQKYKNK